MPKMNIAKSKIINAPVVHVFSIISSMETWQHWSPWLITDPTATVDVAADDRSYSWSGDRVGSGQMQISATSLNKSVDYDLVFLTPWKSRAKIQFQLKEKENGTEVTWMMDSSLPWFMFWMKKMMVALVGNDYGRGLNLLKDYAEDGKVHSSLEWIGEQTFDGCNYIGIDRTCSITDMPELMKNDFTQLMEYGYAHEAVKTDLAFTQYHKFDFIKEQCAYTAAVPIEALLTELPSAFTAGKLEATKIYTIKHTGPYHQVGNAWTTGYMMQRNKEIKFKKGYHPFETYGNSPTNTAPNDLVAYINFAIQ